MLLWHSNYSYTRHFTISIPWNMSVCIWVFILCLILSSNTPWVFAIASRTCYVLGIRNWARWKFSKWVTSARNYTDFKVLHLFLRIRFLLLLVAVFEFLYCHFLYFPIYMGFVILPLRQVFLHLFQLKSTAIVLESVSLAHTLWRTWAICNVLNKSL